MPTGARPKPGSLIGSPFRTQFENTHGTRSCEVLYRWHPWMGVRVFIHAAVQRIDGVVFRCTLSGSDADRWLEVPAWMFDRAACLERATLSAIPCVSALAPSTLAQLLLSVSKARTKALSLSPSGASGVSRDQNRGEAHVGESSGASGTSGTERDHTRPSPRARSDGTLRQRARRHEPCPDMAGPAERDATHADRADGSVALGPHRSERGQLGDGDPS